MTRKRQGCWFMPLGAQTASLQLVQGQNRDWWHPGRSARLQLGPKNVMVEFGELHPQVCRNFDIRTGVALAELDPEAIRDVKPVKARYEKFSRYPASTRDLSLVVDETVEAADIMDILIKRGGDILNRVEFVDVFRSEDVGQGKKSMTFAMEFRHMERTLSDEEINGKMERIIGAVKEKLGGELR